MHILRVLKHYVKYHIQYIQLENKAYLHGFQLYSKFHYRPQIEGLGWVQITLSPQGSVVGESTGVRENEADGIGVVGVAVGLGVGVGVAVNVGVVVGLAV